MVRVATPYLRIWIAAAVRHESADMLIRLTHDFSRGLQNCRTSQHITRQARRSNQGFCGRPRVLAFARAFRYCRNEFVGRKLADRAAGGISLEVGNRDGHL